ncbi:MAG: SUMF1/EgtB/PvdO family nonheme iron enzyme [Pseudomonadota bacterium]
MVDPICPAGMVLQKPNGAVHPDEPAFCIGKTETPQKPYMDFLREKFKDEYEEVRKLLAGDRFAVVGDKKPAVYVKWDKAREYCQSTYPGGDLPTGRQWENACGGKAYCTSSGKLNHREAIYNVHGSSDVGSTPANPRGVQDMTGNVWEWTKDYVEILGGYRIRGGSWDPSLKSEYLRTDNLEDIFPPYLASPVTGFRCVALPQPATEPTTGKLPGSRK